MDIRSFGCRYGLFSNAYQPGVEALLKNLKEVWAELDAIEAEQKRTGYVVCRAHGESPDVPDVHGPIEGRLTSRRRRMSQATDETMLTTKTEGDPI